MAEALQIFGLTAPGNRIDVGDGLGELPAVTGEVGGGVLAFAVWIVSGRAMNDRTMSKRAGVVRVDVLHSDHRAIGGARDRAWSEFCDHQRTAIADIHLNTMVRDPETDTKTECRDKPIHSRRRVRIGEFRNDRSAWDGTVDTHELAVFHIIPAGWPTNQPNR